VPNWIDYNWAEQEWIIAKSKSDGKRRQYDDDLKRESVQMLLDDHSVSSIASNLGLSSANLVYRWKTKQIKASGPATTKLDERVRKFEGELRRVWRFGLQASVFGTSIYKIQGSPHAYFIGQLGSSRGWSLATANAPGELGEA
jgi:transposase